MPPKNRIGCSSPQPGHIELHVQTSPEVPRMLDELEQVICDSEAYYRVLLEKLEPVLHPEEECCHLGVPEPTVNTLVGSRIYAFKCRIRSLNMALGDLTQRVEV